MTLTHCAWHTVAATGAALLLAACGSTKPHYPIAAQAQQQLSAVEAEAPAADTLLTHQRLIEQMQREGLWFASLAHIDALEQRGGNRNAVLRLRADALRQTGQLAQSREVYDALRKVPSPVEAAAGLHGLGLLAGAEGQFAQAASWMAQARMSDPTNPRILGDLGYAYLQAGQLDEARVPLMQAAQLQPTDPRLQLNIATWHLARDEQAEAQQILTNMRATPSTRDAVMRQAQQVRRVMQAAAQAVPTPVPVPASTPTQMPAPANAPESAPAPVLAAAPNSAAAEQRTAAPPLVGGTSLTLRSSSWQGARRVRPNDNPVTADAVTPP